MSKKKKNKKRATAKHVNQPKTNPSRINWGKIKLYATIAFVVWVALAANGISTGMPTAGDGGEVVQASAFGFLPSFTMATPGGVGEPAPPADPVVGVVGPIRPIPDGLNNYRALGVTPAQLRTFLATSGTIKLMNLSGDIPGKITASQVRAVCAEFNVEYLTSGTLDRFAARSGYQEGRGFVRSAASAARHLLGGNVLVIDRSGNRTGALVGAYLVAHHGFSVERVIGHNNWEQFSISPGKSFQYLETVTGAAKSSTNE